jgi:uncharacterized protein YuzE
MEIKPQIRHDADANALYIRFTEAPIARTIEFEEFVYVDLDASGQPLGIEFVDADDFLPFLKRHHGTILLESESIRSRLTANG